MKFSRIPHSSTPKLRGWRRQRPTAARRLSRSSSVRGLRQKTFSKFAATAPRNRGKVEPPGSLSGSGRRKLPRGPGKHWLKKPPVVFRGLREVCNPATPEGRAEYFWRILQMWLRQERLCCNCCQPLKLKQATFEHEKSRVRGERDERLWDEKGKPMNGASHGYCNVLRKLLTNNKAPIHHYPQFVLREDEPMNHEQAEELTIYLKLPQCACGRKKASGEPFCRDCDGKLSPQQRFDLDPMKATYLRGLARVRAYVMDPEAA